MKSLLKDFVNHDRMDFSYSTFGNSIETENYYIHDNFTIDDKRRICLEFFEEFLNKSENFQ